MNVNTDTLTLNNLAANWSDITLFQNKSAHLTAGSALHIKGSNGSGKTTMLRILAGLVAPSSGSVNWCGCSIHEGTSYRQNIAYLGHALGFKACLHVIENLNYMLALAAVKPTQQNISKTLEKVGLTNFAKQPLANLSAGQKQRLALAFLLLSGRKLWLLDEPGSALDVGGLTLLSDCLQAHLQAGGILVYSSHQPLPNWQHDEQVLELSS